MFFLTRNPFLDWWIRGTKLDFAKSESFIKLARKAALKSVESLSNFGPAVQSKTELFGSWHKYKFILILVLQTKLLCSR